MSFNTSIVRISTGFINTVNDAVCGMSAAPLGPGNSKFAGQAGAGFWLDDANIVYDSSVGTVYGGHFRYVQLAASASQPVIGQLVFAPVTPGYSVTTDEAISTDSAMFRCGIVLSASWTPGNWSIIQDWGPAFVKFRAALTAAGAVGSRVFAAAAGGADVGLADVIDSANPALFSDVSLMMGRYIGTALQAPASGGLKLVNVNIANMTAGGF